MSGSGQRGRVLTCPQSHGKAVMIAVSDGLHDLQQERIEAALHTLLGIERKKGPKRGDFAVNKMEIARKAAAEFFWRSVDPRRGEREWKKCIEFALGDARAAAWKADGNKFENFYQDVMDVIRPIEDKLLVEVSAAGLPEWESRGLRIGRVLKELKALGIFGAKSRG